MKRRVAVVGVVLALVAAVAAAFVLLRGDSAEDVAQEYLDALWSGEWETQCELSSEQWQHYLFEGYPFSSCEQYGSAAEKAEEADEAEGDRTVEVSDVQITVTERSEGDGEARVSYLVEFEQQGGESDGSGVDRGTIELVEVDGDWRVGGVDAG